jgi:hypothetical protein
MQQMAPKRQNAPSPLWLRLDARQAAARQLPPIKLLLKDGLKVVSVLHDFVAVADGKFR